MKSTRIWLLSFLFLFTVNSTFGQSIVINEFMASNNQAYADPQGQYEDWIELHNYGSASIDVGGIYLTDNLTIPTKWQIPASTLIPARSYLVIWADDDTADSGLHANYKLDADGEEIGLYNRDGSTLIDSIEFDSQTTDISYGRFPDASDNWSFLATPTPGSRNLDAYSGALEDPKFSHNRGFYNAPFYLNIATETEGTIIYYTVNGNAPYDFDREIPIGTRYGSPIRIDGTTCVRAVAVKTDYKPSKIITHSYIYLDEVIRQSANPIGFPSRWGNRIADYAMDQRVVNDAAYRNEIIDDLKSTPSISIVIDNADFFGSNGIYANPTQTGIQWERPASIEWIDPNTGGHFGVNAGLRIHGGPYSRSQNPKNALRVIFRNDYGPSILNYPLFPDTEVDTFNTLALRSIWNYSWTGHSGMSGSQHADYLRDVFARDTVRDMGNVTVYGRPIQIYVNGLYWGLYILTERPEERYAADHLGGDREDYQILEAPSGYGASTTMEVIYGGEEARQAWNTLFERADADLSEPENYQDVLDYIDVTNMIDYMLMIYYTGSRDAPVFLGDSYTPRNFYVVRNRQENGPFKIVPWDVEWSLEEPTRNRVNTVGVWNPHYIVNRMLSNPEFRILLADRIHKFFHNDGALTTEQATQRYMDRVSETYGAIVGESARWGDYVRPSRAYTRNVEWLGEVSRLENEYFAIRNGVVMNQLRQAGFYPDIEAPDFYIDGQRQHGGNIRNGSSLRITNPNNTGRIYYTLDGSDPRRSAAPSGGGGSVDLVTENASKLVLVPTAADSGISARWYRDDFDASGWQRGTGGVGFEAGSGYERYININVISQMYGINGTCYIRIPFINNSDLEFNRMILKMRYDDGFIAYLNGHEVARRNFTGTPTWNSVASALNDDSAAVNFENMDISSFVDYLRPGENLLAIQGLNQSTSSSDFLISTELVASEVGLGEISDSAIEYNGPITLNDSTDVKARVLNLDTWSALNDATYTVE